MSRTSIKSGAPRRSMARRIAIASFIGTAIEWYDIFLYAACAALIFGPQFFPATNDLAAQLASFATFAVAFLVRPLGGILAGHFGDRYGRRPVLVWSMLAMGLATVGVGLLPTYAQVGVLAPVLLVGLRVIQGLAIGGEYGGAVAMTIESAPARQRAFYSMAVPLGAPAGLILSNCTLIGLSALLGDQFIEWGWRIAFVMSLGLIAVGFVLRRSVDESSDFIAKKERSQRFPLGSLLRGHPRVLAQMVVIAGVPTVLNYVILSYSLAYGTTALDYSRNQMLLVVTVACAVAMILCPFFAQMTDRRGARSMLFASAISQMAGGFVFFSAMGTGNVLVAMIGASAALVPPITAFVAIPIVLADAFPTELRYTAISVAYQVGAAIFGGLAPLVAAFLVEETGTPNSVSVYVVVLALAMLAVVVSWERRTSQASAAAAVADRQRPALEES